jgi:hypothetical protein
VRPGFDSQQEMGFFSLPCLLILWTTKTSYSVGTIPEDFFRGKGGWSVKRTMNFHCTILYYTILYYIILYYIILFCTQCYFSKKIGSGTHRLTQSSVGGGGGKFFFRNCTKSNELLVVTRGNFNGRYASLLERRAVG